MLNACAFWKLIAETSVNNAEVQNTILILSLTDLITLLTESEIISGVAPHSASCEIFHKYGVENDYSNREAYKKGASRLRRLLADKFANISLMENIKIDQYDIIDAIEDISILKRWYKCHRRTVRENKKFDEFPLSFITQLQNRYKSLGIRYSDNRSYRTALRSLHLILARMRGVKFEFVERNHKQQNNTTYSLSGLDWNISKLIRIKEIEKMQYRDDKKLYVVVDGTLSPGLQMAQAIHAVVRWRNFYATGNEWNNHTIVCLKSMDFYMDFHEVSKYRLHLASWQEADLDNRTTAFAIYGRVGLFDRLEACG